MKIYAGTTKSKKSFYKDWIEGRHEHKGAKGGYLSVGTLRKPYINRDFIFVDIRRSKHKNEKKQDDAISFSLNDYEALILASMLTWSIARRMNAKRCNM
jgi:hypothetical protein